jgi:CBS domain-containing protein
MTPYLRAIRSDQTLLEAAWGMSRHDVGMLPVLDPDARGIVGVVTDRDIITRAVARGQSSLGTAVGNVATRRVLTCHQDASLERTRERMIALGVRRLVVLDARRQPAGVLSVADLMASGGGRDGVEGLLAALCTR